MTHNPKQIKHTLSSFATRSQHFIIIFLTTKNSGVHLPTACEAPNPWGKLTRFRVLAPIRGWVSGRPVGRPGSPTWPAGRTVRIRRSPHIVRRLCLRETVCLLSARVRPVVDDGSSLSTSSRVGMFTHEYWFRSSYWLFVSAQSVTPVRFLCQDSVSLLLGQWDVPGLKYRLRIESSTCPGSSLRTAHWSVCSLCSLLTAHCSLCSLCLLCSFAHSLLCTPLCLVPTVLFTALARIVKEGCLAMAYLSLPSADLRHKINRIRNRNREVERAHVAWTPPPQRQKGKNIPCRMDRQVHHGSNAMVTSC